MNRSEEINEIATALSKAQGEFRPVPKDSENPFLHNKYAKLDAVINANRPVLAKYELAISQLIGRDERGMTLETVLLHGSGQWMSEVAPIPTLEIKKGLNEMQTCGIAISYMKRYCECAILNVSTGDDDTDGFTGSTTVKKESPVAKGAQHFDATYVRSLMSSQDKPYMIFGNETEKASWFKGRTTLLTTAPWLTEQGVTKETLGVLDADNALAGVRIHYAFSTKTDNDGNPYKNVVSVEKLGE